MSNDRDLGECQFCSWYSKFPPKYVGKAISIPLSKQFVEYLQRDGVTVPSNTRAFGRPATPTSSESDDSSVPKDELWEFEDLLLDIDEAIKELGGSVFPKLNWSCPKDVVWLNYTNNLCCENSDSVILLLKSSDRISDDLSHLTRKSEGETSSKTDDISAVLTLKKWYSYDRSREFRCFVHFGSLAGVCQRYLNEVTDAFKDKVDDLKESILRFFKNFVLRAISIQSYAFDIYIKKEGNITLVDVNQWQGTTNPLLFTWEELGESNISKLNSETSVEVRFADTEDSLARVSEKAVFGFPYEFTRDSSENILQQLVEEVNLQSDEGQSS